LHVKKFPTVKSKKVVLSILLKANKFNSSEDSFDSHWRKRYA